MPLHDSSYKHWEGIHEGIWQRRAVIAGQGLKSCLQSKFMRNLVVLCWVMALLMGTILFFLGQLLVADSFVGEAVRQFNPRLQLFFETLVKWLEQNPQVSVGTTQNLLFYFFATHLKTLSLIAIAVAIPHLITRDLSSNAIIIYSSKAIGRFDYLLGKFGAVFGLLTLTWLGPLAAAWLLGNLLAPDWRFFWHARVALGHTLLFVVSSMVVLSLLALAVSAISSKEKWAVIAWVAIWLMTQAFIPISRQTKPWLKHASFVFDFDQLSLAIFRLKDDLALARDHIPVLGQLLRGFERRNVWIFQDVEIGGALLALGIMVGVAVVILYRRVKPE